MRDNEWVLLDTETTGFNQPIFVVEIAAQRMLGWEPKGPPFRKLLNQNTDIPPEAARVHGYTREILERDGEPALNVYRDFSDYVGNLRVKDSNWPHIHSILFLHENQVEPFEVLMEDGFNSILTFQDRSGNEPFRNLKSIHAKPITHDLDSVVGYAAKLLDHPEAKHLMRDFPLYDQMPSLH